jgi:hypothetical protein
MQMTTREAAAGLGRLCSPSTLPGRVDQHSLIKKGGMDGIGLDHESLSWYA